MKRARIFAAILTGVLLVAACGDDDDGASATDTIEDSGSGSDSSGATDAPEDTDPPDDEAGDTDDGSSSGESAGIGTVTYSDATDPLDVLSCIVFDDDGGGVVVETALQFDEGLEVATDGSGAVIGATNLGTGATSTSASGSLSADVLTGSADFDGGFSASFQIDTAGCN